ncbi:MAG: S1C family serine protease [Ktedonobacteraceae bacterium]
MQDPYNENTVPYQPQPVGMQPPLHPGNVENVDTVGNARNVDSFDTVGNAGNVDSDDTVEDTGTTAGQYQQPGNGFMPPPVYPPNQNNRSTGGSRVGRTVLLTLLLAIILGALLFGAGWEFGRTATVTNPTNSSVGALQPGSNTAPTVPALTGANVDTVREAVVAKVSPAVVQVNVQTASGSAIGSGVIIDKRGYIVTNNHVVTGAQQIQVVLYDNTKLTAQLVGTDPFDDLAVIKINPPSNITTATLGNSSQLLVGQEVLAIGNPLGITQTVTNGIVSALNRTVSEGQGSNATIPDAIQTDAPINPGNSGGALVDLQGNLIGIPTLTAIDPEFNAPANGVGFAIPSNRVKFIATQIIQYGHVVHTGRAALGIQAISVDPTLQAQDNLAVSSGALVAGFSTSSAAQQAGMQVGDVIVKINNQDITDTSTLSDVLATESVGSTVAVHIYRGNQQLTINVKLGELGATS